MLTRRSMLTASLSVVAADAAGAAVLVPGPARAQDGLVWTAVTPAHLAGQGWRDTAAPFDRLPARAEALVPPEVWKLSRHSAGLSFEFTSDARAVHVRYRLRNASLAMPHMPATGVSGLDVYGRAADDADTAPWRWAAVFQPTAPLAEGALLEDVDAGTYRWRVYLPLYNGVEALELGVPEGATFALAGPTEARPIVCYGTSILHGACASRPGMAWPAIVGRRLARPMVNLGFSGSARMEPALAALLAELDAAAYVVDCAPNMNAALLAERAVPFVEALRAARPNAPIVLVEDRRYGYDWLRATARERNRASAHALRVVYDELRGRGLADLAYVTADEVLGSHAAEALTDGSHPNDLGMTAYADALTPVLRALVP